MEKNKWHIFPGSTWFFPLAATLVYILGLVLAMESGKVLNPVTFFCGLAILIAFVVLDKVNNYTTSSSVNLFSTVGRTQKLKHPSVIALLFAAFAAIFLSIFFLLQQQVLIGVNLAWLVLIAGLMTINFSRVGRIWAQPFQWLIEGLLVSPLMLFWGASLQGFPPVPLMSLLSIGLILLYAVVTLALQYPDYQSDMERSHRSFILLVGWEKGIVIHNLLLILSFLLLGAYIYLGGTWRFHWAVVVMLLVGAFQILQLRRISQGLRPNWGLLKSTAMLLFSAVVYFFITGYLLK